MKAALLVARSEVRRRWGSLIVIALLAAFTTMATATAVAGAHRTATSVERFRTWAHASDGFFQTSDRSQLPDLTRQVLATDHVERLGERWLVNGFLEEAPIRDIAIYSDPANRFGRSIERPRVLRGRMPQRDIPDEIALNEQAANLLHVGPGADLTLESWSTADLQQLSGGTGFPGFNGPVLHLRVVGVVRTLDGLVGDVERGSPYAFAGPGFLAAHPDLGVWPPALHVRARGGAAGFGTISRAVRGGTSADIPNATGTPASAAYLDAVQQGADGSAAGLLIVAVAAALAGGLVVGQSIQRHLATRAAVGRQLVQLGLSRRATAGALSLPVATAALLGSLPGIVTAALTSRWLPLGVAGRAEPDPGIRVDTPALVLCGLIAVALAGTFAFLWARVRLTRVRPQAAPPRHIPPAVRAALAIGAPPAVTTGVQLASDRASESGPVPLRTALLGVVLAIAAIVATGVIVSSHDTLVNNPSRWGRTWDSEPDAFGDASVDDLAARIAHDDRIAAAARISSGTFRIGGRDIAAYALTPVRGQIDATLLDGRLPATADEVALGRQSLADAHARVGDRVRAKGSSGAAAMLLVTGTVVLPPAAGDAHELGVGAVTTRRTLVRLSGDGTSTEGLVLRYPAGTNVPRLERALRRDYNFEFNPFTEVQIPGSVRRLSDTRTIGIALAWFFGVLGLLSLIHALWTGTRRRSIQLTMLRVLGLRRVQVLAAVVIQAVLLVMVAVVVGVPIGLLIGRTAWRLATDHLGAATSPVVPWTALAIIPAAALGGAALLACWPGYRAGLQPPAVTLRVE